MDTRDGSLGVGSDDLPVGGVVEGPVGSALERGVGLGSTAPLHDDPITSNTSNSATGPTIPTVDSTDHSDSNPTSNPTTTTSTTSADHTNHSSHSTTNSATEPTPDPDRTLRVSQLDAEELDDGLVGMLLGKLGVGLEGVLVSRRVWRCLVGGEGGGTGLRLRAFVCRSSCLVLPSSFPFPPSLPYSQASKRNRFSSRIPKICSVRLTPI